MFISIEGGEGTGKTTQIGMLAESLRKQGHDVVTTREPGGTPEAEKIRELLVHRNGGDWTPMAEILLFFAARQMHVTQLIMPALTAGKIVISDRFTDSTRVYQSYGHGVEPDIIESFVHLALGGFEPDMTFILDIAVDKGLARAGRRQNETDIKEDRFEKIGMAFHEKLRQGFFAIAERFPERCVMIDADRTINEIANEMQMIALRRLQNV